MLKKALFQGSIFKARRTRRIAGLGQTVRRQGLILASPTAYRRFFP